MTERLKEGIYRVCIPFENIYTSVFILIKGSEAVILDSGANEDDSRKYVIPAVAELGVTPKYLVSSHTHGDHHGGINALKQAFPDAVPALFSKDVADSYYLTDGEVLLGRFKVLNLKGHSEDSLGILDLHTNTLISCDSLQMYGIDKYRGLIFDAEKYLESINRVRMLKVSAIIASHEYEPLGFMAEDKNVQKFLGICEKATRAVMTSRCINRILILFALMIT